ncbi:DUF1648 domain-containing protein [Sediminibacillus dalangtanensis]|uniref:DUF1648 domain-containing protein n=1 Tax=Sediminibacillus dalangtanensis TaxID=2729421 RepID=A0ABX7VR81_9BACI|nr:DUF5808 domain-containing protein [Sediminibacillus dalangtanensis]QTM97948.1 DUF1648 domain-containing protein [Sediminibacillus dalangtanensis]
MDTLIIAGIFVVCLLPIFIVVMFTPYLTRKTESFGVFIPEDIYQDPRLKKMRRSYVYATGIISVLVMAGSFAIIQSLEGEEQVSLAIACGLVGYSVVSFFVYLVFHKKMKKLKAENKWTEQRRQQVTVDLHFDQKKVTWSNWWFTVPYLLSFLTLLLTVFFYEQIPERIPMQYNFSGEVTNWADKTYRSVLMMPIMQIYLTSLFLFLNTMIAKAKQQLNAANPEKSMEQNIRFRRRWSGYIIVSGTALTLLFAFTQISFIFPVNTQLLTIVPLLLSGAMVAGAIVLAFNTGQGGSRIKTGTDKRGNTIDRDDDKHWKLGQFYFNREDPALFLEKRFGVGWTINFARPLAWTALAVIILLAVAIPWLLGI